QRGTKGEVKHGSQRTMAPPFFCSLLDDLPALRDQRRLKPIRIRDEALQRGLEEQQHKLPVECEPQRVAEGRFNREAVQIVRRAAESPQRDGMDAQQKRA